MVEKEKVLSDALKVLNSDSNPREVTIEGDSVTGTRKWIDVRFFTKGGVSDEDREFTFTVTLKDNRKWKEVNSTSSKTSSIRMYNGKLSFNKDISFSRGKTYQKSIPSDIGQDKKNGKVGTVESKLGTSITKKSTRDYLKQCSWRKAELSGQGIIWFVRYNTVSNRTETTNSVTSKGPLPHWVLCILASVVKSSFIAFG